MTMFRRHLLLSITALALGLIFFVGSIQARSQYKKAFYKKYVDDNADYKEVADDKTLGRCWLCHVDMKKQDPPVEGLKKQVRNNYGVALSKFLDVKEKDKAKIAEALEKAGQEKSDPNDEESPTFAELIADGKLPGDNVPNADDVKAALKKKAEKEAKKQ